MRFSRPSLAAFAATAVLGLMPASASAIVGGTDAPTDKYPATARIVIAQQFLCTGTLIAPDWVLTAGHCGSITGAAVATPVAFPGSAFDVTVNTVNANGAGGEALRVDRVVVPQGYLFTSSNDTSLLHLSAPARTGPVPVAGRGYEALWRPNVLTEIVGFGVTMTGGDSPDTMQQAKVPIVTDAACAAKYSSFEPKTQICAGYPEGKIDACNGDSGGPEYSRTGADRLLVVGATSYGNGRCADPGVPGVYARVADEVLRDGFIRVNAPAGVLDATAGAVTTPAEVYDPATKQVSPGTPSASTASGKPGLASASSAGSASSSKGGGPAPTSSQTAGSASTTTTTTTRTGFRAALAVDSTLRRTVRARGLRFRLRCSAACAATVRLRVDAATTRRLGLLSRTVGTTTVTRDAAGRTTKAVKISRSLVRKLKGAKGAAFVVVATVKESPGGRASVLTARAVLRGR